MNHGKIAYEAYRKATEGRVCTYPWEEIPKEDQDTWTQVGLAVGDAWANKVLLKPHAKEVQEAARRGFESVQHKD